MDAAAGLATAGTTTGCAVCTASLTTGTGCTCGASAA